MSFEKTEAVKENDNRKGKRQDKQYLRFGIRLKGPRGPLWVASRIIPLVTWRGPRGPLRAATRIIPLVTKQQKLFMVHLWGPRGPLWNASRIIPHVLGCRMRNRSRIGSFGHNMSTIS